jgi:hypothetical protein
MYINCLGSSEASISGFRGQSHAPAGGKHVTPIAIFKAVARFVFPFCHATCSQHHHHHHLHEPLSVPGVIAPLFIRPPQTRRIAIERVCRGTTAARTSSAPPKTPHTANKPANPTRPCSLLAWHDPFIEPHPRCAATWRWAEPGPRRRTMAQQRMGSHGQVTSSRSRLRFALLFGFPGVRQPF